MECLAAAHLLEEKGYAVAVINASTVWPLDEKYLMDLDSRSVPIVTVEEHALPGGFGSAVAECCAREGYRAPARMLGLPDTFVPHGCRSELLRRYGLDADGIARSTEEALRP